MHESSAFARQVDRVVLKPEGDALWRKVGELNDLAQDDVLYLHFNVT